MSNHTDQERIARLEARFDALEQLLKEKDHRYLERFEAQKMALRLAEDGAEKLRSKVSNILVLVVMVVGLVVTLAPHWKQ